MVYLSKYKSNDSPCQVRLTEVFFPAQVARAVSSMFITVNVDL